jgi:hypothetical protein
MARNERSSTDDVDKLKRQNDTRGLLRRIVTPDTV